MQTQRGVEQCESTKNTTTLQSTGLHFWLTLIRVAFEAVAVSHAK